MKSVATPNRRDFIRKSLTTLSAVSLVQLISGCSGARMTEIPRTNPVVKSNVAVELNEWIKKLNGYCSDLEKRDLSVVEWQASVKELFSRVEMEDILKAVDFEALIKKMELPDEGVVTTKVQIEKEEKLAVLTKIFGMKPGRAIIPHGHSNMASAHCVLKGQAYLRQFDKVRQDEETLVIKKTVERTAKAGDFSSISDDQDNIHWFIAEKAPLYSLDIIVLDLNDSKYQIHNIDIEKGKKTGDLIETPIIGVKEALSKYGKIAA